MLKSTQNPHAFLVELSDLRGDSLQGSVRRHLPALRQIASWAEEYLCKSHPRLGRSGPVCPFVEFSMAKGLFFLTVCEGPASDLQQPQEVIRTYRDWFLELAPAQGAEALFKAILILFPEVAARRAPATIDVIQKSLKIHFVREGLMIGQFHEINQDRGLWNAGFHPLRSPVPLLAIRYMVPGDFGFLEHDPRYVEAYLKHFAHQIPRGGLRKRVRGAMQRFGIQGSLRTARGGFPGPAGGGAA